MLERLIILGGGGWFPAHGRHTACALLRNGDEAIMIDAGTGVGRFVEQPELLTGVRRLDILLSHFHLDHVAGLAYLPALQLCRETTVWGPGLTLYGTPTEDLLGPLSHEPFHPVPLADQDIQVRDLPAGEIELAGTRIQTRRQDAHTAPSLAFRFDDLLTWITDTAYDEQSASFAAGSRILAHEAWFTTAQPRNPTIHSSASEAASVAVAAESDTLLLIHAPPFEQSVEQLALEAQTVFARSLIAHDGADLSMMLA
jgi:ribonuclease BN (tRNA processing enzyme)